MFYLFIYDMEVLGLIPETMQMPWKFFMYNNRKWTPIVQAYGSPFKCPFLCSYRRKERAVNFTVANEQLPPV